VEWYERVQRIAAAVNDLLDARSEGASICPSEVARAVDPSHWRSRMDEVRIVARHLAARGVITITRRGRRLDPAQPFLGTIRFSR
jgi:hypothetical protein